MNEEDSKEVDKALLRQCTCGGVANGAPCDPQCFIFIAGETFPRERCEAEATHISCLPLVRTPTCPAHKCRCAKLIGRTSVAVALSPEERAERAWEELNVAEMPELEAPHALRNARWAFKAGYLARDKEK